MILSWRLRANLPTGSKLFRVCWATGQTWKSRRFLTKMGIKLSHGKLWAELSKALQLIYQQSVVGLMWGKMSASKGDDFADRAAEALVKKWTPKNVPFLMQVISARFQKHASRKEMDECVEKRAKSNSIGLWESANKIIPVPYFPSAWLVMCHQQNHLSQSSERDFKGTRLLPWLPSRWHYPKWIREALSCQ